MNPILKNILAFLGGGFIGGVLNSAIVALNGPVIPLPEGADVSTMEGLAEAMPLFEAQHFIMPFLAHAIGTLVGAYIAARFAATHKMKFALGIGAFFLLGGITAANMFGWPMPFSAIDILLAYIPMGWLGGKLATK